MELVFSPGKVSGGEHQFAIGSGGSTMLVLQTLLPALFHAGAASSLRIEGGTHNPMAPPFEFVDECFAPVIAAMGAHASFKLERPGFMQAGGGIVTAELRPVKKWKALNLIERGQARDQFGLVQHAHIPPTIAEREIESASAVLKWPAERFTVNIAKDSIGPGNAILLGARFENVCEISSGIAQMGSSAESVGHSAAKGLKTYLASQAPVGVHLADQLLLYMAMGKGGVFRTLALSKHTRTNMALIEKFLPVKWQIRELDQGEWEVSCDV